MPPKHMKMRDAVIEAIERVRTEKCTQNFTLDDFKSQYATIVAQTGSKSQKPQNTINVHLQELVKAGALQKQGRGQFVIVGNIKESAAMTKKASAKKASAKRASAKKASTGKKTSAKKASAKKASAGKKASAKKASTKQLSGSKRKRAPARKRSKTLGFATYIYKVMKRAARQDVGITQKAMAIAENLVADTLHRLASISFDLAQRVGRKTVNESDVKSATKVLLHGELAKYAINEGINATTRYSTSKGGPSTKRAGLVFSVPRTERFFRAMMPHTNISAKAPVFAAAVMEYLLSEVFELSSNFAQDAKRKRIVPRHISMIISGDQELHRLFQNATIARGGVPPNIHDKLLPPPKKSRS